MNTHRGILFRQWANSILKDYMLRGYAVNQRIENLFAFSKMEVGKEVIMERV